MEPISRISFSQIANHLGKGGEDILAFDRVAPEPLDDVAPVRIDGISIMLCEQGEATLKVDLSEYHLKRDSLIVIQPNNFIVGASLSEDFQAIQVLVSHDAVEKIMPKLTDMLPTLLSNRTDPVVQLAPKEAEGIRAFYKFIRLKLDGPETPFRTHKILSMLEAALYELMDIRLVHDTASQTRPSRSEEIVARFILSVCRNFRTERQVAFYAKEMCITPKHLSTVCKEVSGRTASEWIDSYVMMEAKMLLRTTDMTIQEIATQLHFANQSFFGKYFKHHCGLSPSAFREA